MLWAWGICTEFGVLEASGLKFGVLEAYVLSLVCLRHLYLSLVFLRHLYLSLVCLRHLYSTLVCLRHLFLSFVCLRYLYWRDFTSLGLLYSRSLVCWRLTCLRRLVCAWGSAPFEMYQLYRRYSCCSLRVTLHSTFRSLFGIEKQWTHKFKNK